MLRLKPTVNIELILKDPTMDKKQQKRTQILNQRLQTLRQQLAGAKKQMDEPDEIKNLEQQIAAAEAELAKIRQG